MTPLVLTDDQREGLDSGKVSSVIILDTSFVPNQEIYRAVSESEPQVDWGIHFAIRDVLLVPVSKLKKHGFSNEFVREFRKKHSPEQEVAVARIRIRR